MPVYVACWLDTLARFSVFFCSLWSFFSGKSPLETVIQNCCKYTSCEYDRLSCRFLTLQAPWHVGLDKCGGTQITLLVYTGTHTSDSNNTGVQLAYEYGREHAPDDDTEAHHLPRAWVWEAQDLAQTHDNERKAISSKDINSSGHRRDAFRAGWEHSARGKLASPARVNRVISSTIAEEIGVHPAGPVASIPYAYENTTVLTLLAACPQFLGEMIIWYYHDVSSILSWKFHTCLLIVFRRDWFLIAAPSFSVSCGQKQ